VNKITFHQKTEKKEEMCAKPVLEKTTETLLGQCCRMGTRREKGHGGWLFGPKNMRPYSKSSIIPLKPVNHLSQIHISPE
jgi:hypothetical protein